MERSSKVDEIPVRIESDAVVLDGDLGLPHDSRGLVLFAHGSGSSRHSPRNRAVARFLQESRLATLLMDLLTADEERSEARTAHLRFDIGFLSERLLTAADWCARHAPARELALGFFGASTGAGAALVAAAAMPERIEAVVSRGGRPDLAGPALPHVRAPTLLIVGGNDHPVIELNKDALARLGADEKELRIVPGATHLFEEPGALEEVADLAAEWFSRHLGIRSKPRAALGRG